jgi:hypothetical protein
MTYQPIESGDRAQIRLTADAPNGKFFVLAGAFQNATCDSKGGGRITILTDKYSPSIAQQHVDLKMPGGDAIPIANKHEMEIPANRPFTVVLAEHFYDGRISNSCSVTLSFVPLKDAQYEFRFIGSVLAQACSAQFNRLVPGESSSAVRRVAAPSTPLKCSYPGSW